MGIRLNHDGPGGMDHNIKKQGTWRNETQIRIDPDQCYMKVQSNQFSTRLTSVCVFEKCLYSLVAGS